MLINGPSRWPLDSNLFSASSMLYIYNSKYQFPFQTADDCLGKEKILAHLKFHCERKPLKLLSCANGRGICNHGPRRDSNNISVVLRSPAFAKHGKKWCCHSRLGEKTSIWLWHWRTENFAPVVLWWLPLVASLKCWRKQSHCRYGILWLPIRKKKS